MILQISEVGGGNLLEASTTDPKSPFILHSVEGWRDSSLSIETESRAFVEGDVVIKTHRGQREVKMNLSYWDASAAGITSSINAVDALKGKDTVLRITFQAEDIGRTAGAWEQVSGAIVKDISFDIISGREFSFEITFLCLNQTTTRGAE